jgi:SAM-dependent methyltransferase
MGGCQASQDLEHRMKPTANIYDSPRLAAGYAFGRPPVHQVIVRAVAQDLGISTPVARALDVGCGAGVSTAALDPIAATIVGLEPMSNMLAHRRDVFPRGLFVLGRAEALPFSNATFDLIAAAGSINYADTSLFLRSAARLLRRGGVLVVYDFSDGKRFRNKRSLEEWYESFERLYPSQPGYALDVRRLDFADAGLRLERYRNLEVPIPMSLDTYLRYAMSQTSVETAISRGVPEDDIGEWCATTLKSVFGNATYEVLFDAYVAYIAPIHDQGNAAGPVL